jgi:hypothetical protein
MTLARSIADEMEFPLPDLEDCERFPFQPVSRFLGWLTASHSDDACRIAAAMIELRYWCEVFHGSPRVTPRDAEIVPIAGRANAGRPR